MGSRDYPRLRLGIGAQAGTDSAAAPLDQVGYVLGTFLPEERVVLDSTLERAADAVQAWLDGAELESLMTTYNGTP